MAGDVANPRIWTGADVYVAPVGTSYPATVAEAWGAAWKALGLLSEDGMTESRGQDVADHYSWGGNLVRTTMSKFKRTFKFIALENNPVVFGIVNPGSIEVTHLGITQKTIKNPTSNPKSWGFNLTDGLIINRRIVPRGEVVEVGDITFSDADMTGYELTVNIYPVNDVLYYDITNDTQDITAS